MKKILLAVLGLAAAAGAYAQADVVKAGERAMKDGKDAAEVIQIITPAFTNPETQGMAQTWFIPGKASYAQYDKLLGLKQFNRLPENGDVQMGKLLISGYEYFLKALPLDSVPNAKGKVKPKYSKEIVNTIAGHATDYLNAGSDLYNAGDRVAAYKAWQIFNTLPEMPALQGKLQAQPDSLYGEIYFNQGIAAWQSDMLNEALEAFMNAMKKDYHKQNVYDYAISIASQLGRNDTVLAICEEAQPLYGNVSDLYVRQIINYYLQARNFDRAFEILNQAIAAAPDEAAYYVIQGVLYENQEKAAEAIASYEKAVELAPDNAEALFNLGRMLCSQAYAAADAAPTVEAEYVPYAAQNITPLFERASGLLEHAYEIGIANQDNCNVNLSDVLTYLENVYYNLGNEAKLRDVQQRKTYL